MLQRLGIGVCLVLLGAALPAWLHFDVATPNAFIQEYFDDFHVAWSSDLFEGAPVITDGFLAPSEAPGHGVTVNEAETGKHPYSERNFMNLFSAGWEKRNS